MFRLRWARIWFSCSGSRSLLQGTWASTQGHLPRLAREPLVSSRVAIISLMVGDGVRALVGWGMERTWSVCTFGTPLHTVVVGQGSSMIPFEIRFLELKEVLPVSSAVFVACACPCPQRVLCYSLSCFLFHSICVRAGDIIFHVSTAAT